MYNPLHLLRMPNRMSSSRPSMQCSSQSFSTIFCLFLRLGISCELFLAPKGKLPNSCNHYLTARWITWRYWGLLHNFSRYLKLIGIYADASARALFVMPVLHTRTRFLLHWRRCMTTCHLSLRTTSMGQTMMTMTAIMTASLQKDNSRAKSTRLARVQT